ncbi:MAG: type II toxin-antitoxin system HipA family toxin [Alcaligenaceae bacterium]|nr:type II toxin-antitoxin system HipA family toxin [Alcaligenaceae bacterium]
MSALIQCLRLYLHGPKGRRAIGYLSRYGDVLRVAFDQDYINDPSRPVLSLSYTASDETNTRAILSSVRDSRLVRNDGKWPAFFQNVLPEGPNRERLARHRGCATENEFELLAAAGHDLMGGLEVVPVPLAEGVPDVVRLWHRAMGSEGVEPGFVEDAVEDEASLPGVVTKFSAIHDGRRYLVHRQGQAGSFILKLPSTRHPDLVHNEFTGYRLMRALELDCAHATIISRQEAELPEEIPFPEILAVQRFDRGPGGRRIHMEEFAQVLGYEPRHKYGKGIETDFITMVRVLDRLSETPAHDIQEFVNRYIAFILMGNTDAHLKNWALIYKDGVTPRLAPLYDPVSVSAFFSEAPAKDYGLNRAIDTKLHQLGWQDLEGILAKAGILRRSRVIQLAKSRARQAQADWPILLRDGPVAMRQEIERRLKGGLSLTSNL